MHLQTIMTIYNIISQNTTLKYIKIYAYYFSVEKNRNILYNMP